ncbi:hypothetical protein GQ607_010244, partial [Colletotrichum asianum]
ICAAASNSPSGAQPRYSPWCSWFITFDCNGYIVIERSLVRFWKGRTDSFAQCGFFPWLRSCG